MPQAAHLGKVAGEAAAGKREEVEIFGNDYDTPDGTCIRDFIHGSDLARAHVNALDYLRDHRESLTLNCGYGRGHSVREVLDGIRRISGRDIPLESRHGAREMSLPWSQTILVCSSYSAEYRPTMISTYYVQLPRLECWGRLSRSAQV